MRFRVNSCEGNVRKENHVAVVPDSGKWCGEAVNFTTGMVGRIEDEKQVVKAYLLLSNE
jgi:hypothetical protein